MGPWVRELQAHLNDVVDGRSCVKYFHKSVFFPFRGLVYARKADEIALPMMARSRLCLVSSRSTRYVSYSYHSLSVPMPPRHG